MKISDFIGETTEYDKKELLEERRPKSWLKSVSAFANGIGGVLFFGVSDAEKLIGLENAKETSEKISEIIKSKMDPVPQIILEIHSEDKRDFIILRILSGQETPYYYVGDGNRIAYVRIGNESVPASTVDLKRLVLRGGNYTYDSLSTQYRFEDYAFTKLRSVYRQRAGFELHSSYFLSFGLIDENDMLTNAGALLADEPPIRFSRVFCTRWHGLNKTSGIIEALDDKEISGSLITLLQSGEEFVRNNTKKRWKKTKTGRIEMPEYPERAVLECIVNGLIDGSLIQEQNIDHIASRRRNPVIADIFNRMNYMERRGSGFKKIREDYHNAVNFRPELEPVFYSDMSTFQVTLYNLNYQVTIGLEKVAVDDEKVLIEGENLLIEEAIGGLNANSRTKIKAKSLFIQMGYDTIFGRTDIMKLFNVSVTAAGNLLNKLKEAEIIESVKGHGKGKYRFVKEENY